MKVAICAFALFLIGVATAAQAADNQLSQAEKEQGWILLFDGHSLDGWMTSSGNI